MHIHDACLEVYEFDNKIIIKCADCGYEIQSVVFKTSDDLHRYLSNISFCKNDKII